MDIGHGPVHIAGISWRQRRHFLAKWISLVQQLNAQGAQRHTIGYFVVNISLPWICACFFATALYFLLESRSQLNSTKTTHTTQKHYVYTHTHTHSNNTSNTFLLRTRKNMKKRFEPNQNGWRWQTTITTEQKKISIACSVWLAIVLAGEKDCSAYWRRMNAKSKLRSSDNTTIFVKYAVDFYLENRIEQEKELSSIHTCMHGVRVCVWWKQSTVRTLNWHVMVTFAPKHRFSYVRIRILCVPLLWTVYTVQSRTTRSTSMRPNTCERGGGRSGG